MLLCRTSAVQPVLLCRTSAALLNQCCFAEPSSQKTAVTVLKKLLLLCLIKQSAALLNQAVRNTNSFEA